MANDTKALAPIDLFRKDLTAMTPEFSKALPPHVSPDKFTRVIMTAVGQNPDILKSDKRALFGACMRAAQDGLLPDGREAALVMFGSNATYMPMIAGILKKARNSGEISTLAAEAVYEKDRFSYHPGVDKFPDHQPDWFGDRGAMVGAYAFAQLKDGSTMVEIMSIKDIEQVRAVSRSKGSGPWVSWFGEMARKTVLRRLSKRLPSSSDREDDLMQTIRRDDELYDIDGKDAVEQPAPSAAPEKQQRRPRGLQTVIDQGGQVIDGESREVPPADPEDPGAGPADDVPL